MVCFLKRLTQDLAENLRLNVCFSAVIWLFNFRKWPTVTKNAIDSIEAVSVLAASQLFGS